MNLASPLKDRILAAVASEPSLTRRQGRRLSALAVFLALAVGAVVFEIAGGLPHGRDRPLAITVKLADGWALASSVLTWLAMGRGESTLARGRTVLLCATMAAPLLLFAWTRAFFGTYEEPRVTGELLCLPYQLIAGAFPLGAFLALRRGAEPQHPRALGAAAGAACAGWAGVLAFLWCPLTGALHVIAAHVIPMIALIAAGALLGPPLLAASGRSCILRAFGRLRRILRDL